MANDCTVNEIRRLLKTPGRHRVSENLYLQAKASGAASWLFRYMRDRQAHWMGLGRYKHVSLHEARQKANDLGRQLYHGNDPLDAKRQAATAKRIAAARGITFGECAKKYIAAHDPSWKNDKHAAQWHTVFKGSTRAAPATAVINDLSVGEIDTALALKVLEPIWHKTPETASRVRQRCEQIISWASAREYRAGANPFTWRGHLDKLLPKPAKLKKEKGSRHHPALPYGDLPQFMSELRINDFISAHALEFLILTATRTNEVINASWDEFDLREKIWVVPAVRMKAGKEHRVPLSERALAILSILPREEGNPYVFVGSRSSAPLSNMAMLELMRGLRPGFVPHGFRATFRTWAAERTSYPHHVCEAALAHTIPDAVVRSYQRSDLFDKRRKLMGEWDRYCASPPVTEDAHKVTPLRRRRSRAS